MPQSGLLLGAATAVFLASTAFAEEPTLANEQSLSGITLDLAATHNAATSAVDVSTEPFETVDLDIVSGDFNLQDNAFALTFSDEAHSTSAQSLLGLAFSAVPASSEMRNTLDVEITADDGVAGHVGFNAAAGAFNLQSNMVVIAAFPMSVLAHSIASNEQAAQQNISTHHDAINEIDASIALGTVSGSVGINIAAGVGNVQLNSVTTTLGF